MSDDMIKSRIGVIVKNGNLDTLTIKSVRSQLEIDFGMDLSAKKDLIKTETLRLLENMSTAQAAAPPPLMATNTAASSASTLMKPMMLNSSGAFSRPVVAHPPPPPPPPIQHQFHQQSSSSTSTSQQQQQLQSMSSSISSAPAKKRSSSSSKSSSNSGTTGNNKPSLSRELAAITGVTHANHFETVKLVWNCKQSIVFWCIESVFWP
jgi:hypothetical protein